MLRREPTTSHCQVRISSPLLHQSLKTTRLTSSDYWIFYRPVPHPHPLFALRLSVSLYISLKAAKVLFVRTTSVQRRSPGWRKKPRRPISQEDLRILLCIVHVGCNRATIDSQSAWKLMADASTQRRVESEETECVPVRPLSLLSIVLSAAVPESLLPTIASFALDEHESRERFVDQIENLERRIDTLVAANGQLRASVETSESHAQAQADTISEMKRELESLESRAIEHRASYLHRLENIRGHASGTLEDRITSWLQTCLEALRSDPPRIEYVNERIEESLRLIEKEIAWLQRSE